MERSSSFARSFFQAGAGAGNDNPYGYGNAGGGPGGGQGGPGQPGAGGDMFGGQTMGTPRAQRRRSSRRRSRGGFGGTSDASMLQSAAAAAAASMNTVDGNEPTSMAGGGGFMTSNNVVANQQQPTERRGQQQRQPSWYREALLQGGAAEDLNAFLGEASNLDGPSVADDEVLEQYRIMAHMEASKQVKENIGFDLASYEERRQMNPDNASRGDYSKKPKPIFPEPRKLTPAASAVGGIVGMGGIGGMQAEEPPLPPPRVNRRFVDQRSLRVPELCAGTMVNDNASAPPGEVLVQCLGCRTQLSVKLLSSLVNCPRCKTVSPATTTRH